MIPAYIISSLCIVSFAVTLINYSILCGSQVEELNWKIKETFYALLALIIIALTRVLLDVIPGAYNYAFFMDAKKILEFVVVIYIFVFNFILLETILKSSMSQVKLCKDCLNIPFYIAVLWMIFERVRLSPNVADVVVIITALVVFAILVKLFKYIKLLSLIVEPANLQPSLMAYLVFMMFYLASILANIYEKAVASDIYIVSFIIAVFSMVLLDLEFRKIAEIHLL